MIRKFNYTDRIKIFQKHILVTWEQDDGGAPLLRADIDLVPYGDALPPEAQVYVEAYHRRCFQRFCYGTVHHIVEPSPDKRRLTEFSELELANASFRLKIVDEKGKHGRIVGMAKTAQVVAPDAFARDRISLLGFDTEPMGQMVWRLDLEERPDKPYIVLNKSLSSASDLAKNDEMFLALVYPEVIRQILRHVLLECDENWEDAEEDEDNWRYHWYCWAADLVGHDSPIPKTQEDRSNWIEDCVEAFCRRKGCFDSFERRREK